MQFGLFFFANHSSSTHDNDKYRLILEASRWADQHGFVRVWTPERHFHSFGGLSPNPSVLAAAIATTTQRVQICAGSVVLPLHDPIRVAEEWAVVDNLSHGRVGLGVAAGWVPNDFVINGHQADFASRKSVFADHITRLRQLWRGEPVEATNPLGATVRLQTIPRPLQRELPLWITAAANPDTFRQAGDLGANVLTHLLGQSVEGLAEKIAAYRDAWRAAGHDGHGVVTLMLHTLVGYADDAVRELARAPMKQYLAGSLTLAAGHLASVPFLQRGGDIDVSSLTPDMADAVLEASFEKYFHMSSLMGSYEKCLDMVDRLEAIGVDEIACLIDFGVADATVLAALDHLHVVRLLAQQEAAAAV